MATYNQIGKAVELAEQGWEIIKLDTDQIGGPLTMTLNGRNIQILSNGSTKECSAIMKKKYPDAPLEND